MTASERKELGVLRERFPHIQEIHGDSMDSVMLSGFLLGAALVFLYFITTTFASGEGWNPTHFFLKLAGVVICGHYSGKVYSSATEENQAIRRYFTLLQKERDIAEMTLVAN